MVTKQQREEQLKQLRPNRRKRGVKRAKTERKKLTRKLVEELYALPICAEIERPIDPKRIDYLKAMIDDDRYHAFDWVQLCVGTDGEVFSGNGRHSRHLFHNFPEYIESDMEVLLQTVYCENLDDAAAMYTGWDGRGSARKHLDEVRAITGSHPDLASVLLKLRGALTTVWFMTEVNDHKFAEHGGFKNHSVMDRAESFRAHPPLVEFAQYMDQFLHKNLKRANKLMNIPILIALYYIWQEVKDPTRDLTPFIMELRDGGVTDDYPTARWRDWVTENVCVSSSALTKREREGRVRRVHQSVFTYFTLETWNRWCKGGKSKAIVRMAPTYDLAKIRTNIRKGRR